MSRSRTVIRFRDNKQALRKFPRAKHPTTFTPRTVVQIAKVISSNQMSGYALLEHSYCT